MPVVLASVVLGALGLVAAVGLWRAKAWAAWLALAVSVLNALSTAPGITAAPNAGLAASAAGSVIGSVLVIALVLTSLVRARLQRRG